MIFSKWINVGMAAFCFGNVIADVSTGSWMFAVIFLGLGIWNVQIYRQKVALEKTPTLDSIVDSLLCPPHQWVTKDGILSCSKCNTDLRKK